MAAARLRNIAIVASPNFIFPILVFREQRACVVCFGVFRFLVKGLEEFASGDLETPFEIFGPGVHALRDRVVGKIARLR